MLNEAPIYVYINNKLNTYLPTLNTDGEVRPVFNVDDFDRQNSSVITYADLQDYAYLFIWNE